LEPPGQDQAGTGSPQADPEVASSLGLPQPLGQGIEQALGNGEPLPLATLPGSLSELPRSCTGHGEHGSQLMQGTDRAGAARGVRHPARMGAAVVCCPVTQSAAVKRDWPPQALEQAVALHRSLSIGDRDWHALKAQRPRRGAEQIAAALVQLLGEDSPASTSSTAARERAIALLEHGLAWLRQEISDPGCPSHGR
jgi:hypothetical protein